MKRNRRNRTSSNPSVGDMTVRIELLRREQKLQGLGANTNFSDLSTVHEVWAYTKNLNPNTFLDYAAVNERASILFVIRYIPNLNHNFKVKYRDAIYTILNTRETSDAREFVELYCTLDGHKDFESANV